MFEDYRVIVGYQGGEMITGYQPEFIPEERRISYFSQPAGGVELSATLRGARIVLLLPRGEAEDPIAESGGPFNLVEARFPDGAVIQGMTCAAPVGGGHWLKPLGRGLESVLVFIPYGAPVFLRTDAVLPVRDYDSLGGLEVVLGLAVCVRSPEEVAASSPVRAVEMPTELHEIPPTAELAAQPIFESSSSVDILPN